MRTIDPHRMADASQFSKFHGMVLFWCAIIIVFDGHDLAVAGVALPSIMKEMGVDATQAGFMVSSALFGMMFGNVIFGTLADRIGRRWVIAICIVLFSAFTAAAGMMKDTISFSVMRFLAGLGIGGVMPCVVAKMSEYAPLRTRSALVSVMFSGYSVGGMLATMFALAAVSITLLGYKMPTPVLFILVGLAGATTIGAQIVNCAYCSQFYPATCRTTGVGMMLGVGRAAILAPIMIGVIVSMALPMEQNFMAISIPAAIAVFSILLVDHKRSFSMLAQAA